MQGYRQVSPKFDSPVHQPSTLSQIFGFLLPPRPKHKEPDRDLPYFIVDGRIDLMMLSVGNQGWLIGWPCYFRKQGKFIDDIWGVFLNLDNVYIM
jgi:hypothetical protein